MSDDVLAEQRRLNEALTRYHFPALALDGVAGPLTVQAQGASRLLAGLDGLDSLRGLGRLGRHIRHGRGGRWVVVDKSCQVLVAGEGNGRVRFVLPATTGTPEHETRLSDSVPAFRYEPATENGGWRNSTTFPVASDDPVGGNMYRPVYFDRGIAIHGSLVVPPYPNSQGCVCVVPAHHDLLLAWLRLDRVSTPTWDARRIGLTVTVQGAYNESPGDISGETARGAAARPARVPQRAGPPASTHLPDANQALLLRAGIVGGDTGRNAWLEWLAATEGDDRIDQASERLLPLVYWALARDDEGLVGRARLLAHYRQSWYLHNRLLHQAKPAVRALQAAGHEVMIIKGAALARHFYPDLGVRPISDVDILVRDDACAAVEELELVGWVGDDPAIPASQLLSRSHAAGLSDGRGGHVDVHRRVVELSRPGIDGPMWERAVTTSFGDVTVLTPCAADELLIALVHGWAWSPISSIRWIADAAAIVNVMDGGDWRLLIDEARRRDVSFRVSKALNVVHDRFNVAVPEDVLAELATGPFARFERAEERHHTAPDGRAAPGVFAYYEHCRAVGPPNGVGWWRGFAAYYYSLIRPPDGGRWVTWLHDRARRRYSRMRSLIGTNRGRSER